MVFICAVRAECEEGGLVLGEDGSLSGLPSLEGANLWEDEDAKAFYTNLPQLKAILPSILYSESEKSAAIQVRCGDTRKMSDFLLERDLLLSCFPFGFALFILIVKMLKILPPLLTSTVFIIIYHDFLSTPRRGSRVKSDKTHTQSSRYTP